MDRQKILSILVVVVVIGFNGFKFKVKQEAVQLSHQYTAALNEYLRGLDGISEIGKNPSRKTDTLTAYMKNDSVPALKKILSDLSSIDSAIKHAKDVKTALLDLINNAVEGQEAMIAGDETNDASKQEEGLRLIHQEGNLAERAAKQYTAFCDYHKLPRYASQIDV